MKKPQTYFYSADLIRAIAIVFVVVVHVCSEYLGKGLTIGTGGWWFANILETIAKVAVPLFVMLSGSLLLDPQKDYSLKEFYKRRFSAIGIPLLFWPLFYYLSFHLLTRTAITLTRFVNDYIFLNMFYHLYFLYIIAGLYFVAPFLQKMLSHLNSSEKKVLVTGALLFSLLITPLVYFTPIKINYWSIFTVFIPFIGYFLAGQLLQNVKLSKMQINRRLFMYVMLTIVIAFCKYFSYSAGSYGLTHYFDDVLSVGVMAMSLLLYPVLLNFDVHFEFLSEARLKSFVINLSAASFGIYLIHPIVLFAFNFLSPRISSLPNFYLLSVTNICFVTFSSLLTVFALRRIRALRLFL